MLAFYAMGIFFEGFLVSAFLAIFLNCVVVLLLLSVVNKPHWLKWMTIGFLIGLSSLTSASILLFLPFLAFWVFRYFKEISKKRLIIHLAICFIGVSSVIAPVTLRNYLVGKDFVPITAHSGITFYAGNNYLTQGSFHLPRDIGRSLVEGKRNARAIAERSAGKELKPSEISKFWFDQGLDFIKKNPSRYLILASKKVFLFWSAQEIPDILPFSFFKQYAPLLKLPLFNFSLISPLALFGMFLCLKFKRPGVSLLYLFIINSLLSTVIYFVNTRYKMLAVPYLIIFSAVSVYWFYIMIINKKLKNLVIPVVAIVVLVSLTQIKILEFKPAQAYNNLGIILKRQKRYEEAIAAYKKASDLSITYDSPHYNLGLLYFDQKKYNQSIPNFKKALKLNPNFSKAHKKIGQAYFETGKKEKAMYHLRQSLRLNPHQPKLKDFVNRQKN